MRHGAVFVRVSSNSLIRIENYSSEGTTQSQIPRKENEVKEVISCRENDGSINSEQQNESVETPTVNRITQNVEKDITLSKGTNLQNKLGANSEWTNSEITSRAGKSTGKYKNWYNVKDAIGEARSIDLEKCEWKLLEASDSEVQSENEEVLISETRNVDNETLIAKQAELES